MKTNILIFVAKEAGEAERLLKILKSVIKDFNATCGNVAELEIVDEVNIQARYIESESWESFLTGICYAISNKLI